MPKAVMNEKEYQRYIIDYLVRKNGYTERIAKTDYNRGFAMDFGELFEFFNKTQPEKLESLNKIYKAKTEDTIIATINQQINQDSLIETIKGGVEISNIHLDLVYGLPATSFNRDLIRKYNANRLAVMEEVYIDDAHKQRMDLVIFLNGLAIISFELKCENSGQDYRNAIRQYSQDRDPKNRLFLFKAGTLVNFAMDLNNCFMTTRLQGEDTYFIPFNRGRGEYINTGAGNPIEDGVDDYPVHYIWDDVLTKDSIIELITKFVFIEKKEEEDPITGKKKIKESIIFPRYHQRDAVHTLLNSVIYNGASLNYLIEHSAGSGKTNTIAWLAHRLSSLHNNNDEIIFDNTIIVTDRIVVDRQLQAAVKGIDHKTGLIKTIDDKCDSKDLADALKGNTKIIVTTIQKFLYILDIVKDLSDKKFAVIIDEAHSSTSGKDMQAVTMALGKKKASGKEVDEEESDAQDEINAEIAKHGKPENVAFFAFTATPKGTTLKLFGTPTPTDDGRIMYMPAHIYSMKQAIEEGFILDVLSTYIEYKTFYQINKAIAEDPKYQTDKAKKSIARFIDLDDTNIGQRIDVIVQHFRTCVKNELGGQAKAMIVTKFRDTAVKYRKALQDYIDRHGYDDIKALVAFTGKVSADGKEYTESSMNGFPESKLPAMFDTDQYNVLLVANKYQVGFDQPKLCAMYIIKKLKGVNAVQTLSRLNRPCKPYDKKTFILDFENTCADMEKAFEPYYTGTILTNTVTATQLRMMESKVDGYNVLDEDDIDKVSQIIYGSDKKITAKDSVKINQLIDRAILRLENMYDEDHQKEFRQACKNFVKLYNFLSIASPFGDAELHKKYVFVDQLLTHLIYGNGGGVNLKDKINATNFRQENQGDKGIKKAHPSTPLVALSGVEIKLTVSEEKRLSEIIDEVNARAGKQLDNDVITKSVLQIKDLLLKSEKLKTSARNNSEKDFEFSYYDDMDEALVEGLSQNQDFFTFLLDNVDVKRQVLGIFLHDVYDKLRKDEKDEVK